MNRPRLNVLVTGAAGFIGSHIGAHLAAQGCGVFADSAVGAPRQNLNEEVLLRAMRGARPDAIVHAAGSGTVAQVAARPADELPANLGVLVHVLQFAQKHAPSARLVLLSSAALYGDAPATPQAEGDARHPVSLYGVAKMQAEQIAAFFAQQHGVASTAIRLFSVYGPGLRKQLLWDAMNKFAAGRSEFFGTGRELRDWVHIEDVCRFIDSMLAQPQRNGFEVYNCAGSPATTAEVLTLLANAAAAPAPTFSGQSRPGDPVCLVADCSKAERELGWRAKVNWRVGVADYAAWFARTAAAGAAT